jgi:hypothetical protein
LIIRNGGGNKGIKEYLEEGRKVDRHMSRDELDKRIPIEGDLIVTQAVIDTIPDNKQERYLHITMSFNEPDVDEDKMMEVYQQYKKELMHAYGDDEFNIYAEIHWPKVKESYNFKTEVMEPRFPHVHIVIPKKNLLTGGFLNPLGMHEKSLKYIDAIQEKLNRENGLSSPRESPRVGFNHYETALGKYKDKEFASKNGEVKRDIHNALVARDIRSLEKFEQLLNEFGEVKVRNAGKPTQYFAIKVSGDQKFTNLKGNLFTPEYIKDRSLVIDPITDAQIEKRIESWRSIQSLEIKYVSNASAKVKEKYRNFTLPERRAYLIERENSYDGRYRKPNEADRKRAGLPGLPERNNQPGDFEFAARRPTERASYLHELRASNVDHFRSEGDSANRLFLSGNEDNDIFDLPANGRIGLRRDLYVGGSGGGSGSSGSSQAGLTVPLVLSDPQSSVLTSLLQAEEDKNNQQRDLERFAEIRKKLDPLHLLAYAQLKFGVDPENHLVSKAKDGSARIKVGKFNYNVSDFLTKHIGLEWAEASSILTELYEKQQNGITDRPKAKVVLMEDWRRFREDVYPKNIKTYDQLKNQIRVSFDLGLKAINAEYFARKKTITKDQTLTRTDKHYFRSVVILEKLQKIEALQQRIEDQKNLSNRIKYPYSTLFYDYATKNEEISMKILDTLKKRYQDPVEESVNVIGGRRPMTPQNLPNGVEAVKRARLVAKLHAKERENKELKIKLGDLRPRPQQDGSVVFSHKDNGQRIFVNHPDRLEMNRKTEPDEVGVGLMFALERFGNPLEIGGSAEFKEQIILVAAERDMDITFTDESLNRALEAKRLELGLDPLVGNTITVPEPELDRTLPLNEAVDQALLASKVAELNAVNSQLPYSMAEQAIHTDMLAEAIARHEEVESGFIDNDRIEQIAKEDLEAFVYLQSKPEQQPLAISMGTAMQNDVYSSYVDQHGPQELKLTIDAAQVVAAQQPAAQQPESQVRFIRPDMATALEQNQRLERPATDREPENFTNWPDAISMSARLHQDYDLEPRSPEYSRNVAAIAIEASAYVEANPAGQDELFGKDRAFHQGELAKDMGRLMGQNEDYRSYVENHAPHTLLTRVEQAAAPAEVPRPAAPEPLTFTHNGEPATIDLERFQPQPQAEQPAPAEVPRPAAPEPLTFTHNGEPATIDLERFQAPQIEQPSHREALETEWFEMHRSEVLGNRAMEDDARSAIVQALQDKKAELKGEEAASRANKPLSERMAERFGINLGDKAYEIGRVNHALKEIGDKGAAAERTEQRAFEDRNLERGLPATYGMEEAREKWIAAQEFRITDAGLQPARNQLEIDPEITQRLVTERAQAAKEIANNYAENGSMSDAGSLVGDTANKLSLNESTAKIEQLTANLQKLTQEQQRSAAAIEARSEMFKDAVAEMGSDQAQTQLTPEVAQAWGKQDAVDLKALDQSPIQDLSVSTMRENASLNAEYGNTIEHEQVVIDYNKREAELERRGQLTNDEKQVEDLAVNDPERLAELRTQHDLAAAERNQQRAAAWEGREQATVEVERPAAPEPLNFTHNGQPATIDLERFKSPAEQERRGQLTNDEKQVEDLAVNDPERLAELRTQHDLAAAERNQQRAAAWEGREQAKPAVQLTPAVAARVIELREVNNAFAKADPEQVYDDIVRKGTLADANMRHDELDSGFVDSDKIREIASEDLKAFGYLEGKPEQQALALSMGRAMENEHYSAYMADNAPESVGITIEASAVVSNEQQTMAPTEIESPSDKDMEL